MDGLDSFFKFQVVEFVFFLLYIFCFLFRETKYHSTAFISKYHLTAFILIHMSSMYNRNTWFICSAWHLAYINCFVCVVLGLWAKQQKQSIVWEHLLHTNDGAGAVGVLWEITKLRKKIFSLFSGSLQFSQVGQI